MLYSSLCRFRRLPTQAFRFLQKELQSLPFSAMDTVKEPLDMPEYVDRFFKHCDQTLDTVQEGGIATSDLVLLPAEDSPEGRHFFIFRKRQLSLESNTSS